MINLCSEKEFKWILNKVTVGIEHAKEAKIYNKAFM